MAIDFSIERQRHAGFVGLHHFIRVQDMPRGLAALIASAWERIAVEPLVVDGLGILCAAREALTLDELGRVAGWTGEPQRRAFVRGVRELLIEGSRADPCFPIPGDSDDAR